MLPDIPRRTDGEDVLVAAGQQRPLQQPAALVVKKVFVPLILDQLGDHHDNVALGILL